MKINKNSLPAHWRGFTLIELIVVMSIIGVLATLIINNLNDARARARDTKRKQDLNQLKTAIRLYYNDNQSYPNDAFGRYLPYCGGTGTDNCQQGDQFSVDTTTYMNQLPEYQYDQTESGENFVLKVILENPSDPNIETSQASCPGYTYADTEYVLCAD